MLTKERKSGGKGHMPRQTKKKKTVMNS